MPRMRITAVESKTQSGEEPLPFDLRHEPYAEGIQQVGETLDALYEAISVGSPDLEADVKLASIFEYLASEILAQIAPISVGEDHKLHILDVLSAMSRRQLVIDQTLELDGMVVVTQPAANVKTQAQLTTVAGTERNWSVEVVLCGIPALRNVLESGLPPTTGRSTSDVGPEIAANTRPAAEIARASAGTGATPKPPKPKPSSKAPKKTASDEATDQIRELIARLQTACRVRNFPIGEIDVSVVGQGPTLIGLPVALEPGAKLAPIEAATGDLARELGVAHVSVENDPQRPYHIRFLVPRPDRAFPTVPSDLPPAAAGHYLPLWLGAQVYGDPFVSHVSEWPHLLVAGTTGSGKTTFLRSILQQVDRLTDETQLVIVDGKAEYDYVGAVPATRFPAEFPDVQLGHEHVVPVLDWIVNQEIPRRRAVLAEYFRSHPRAPRSAREAYTQGAPSATDFVISPFLVVIDEFAEIMLSAGAAARQFEDLVQRVVQTGRSSLVHLVMATQRPDANVVRGAVKANLPSRVALALPSHHDSMTILNAPGAEELIGKGDLLFQSSAVSKIRLQAYQPL